MTLLVLVACTGPVVEDVPGTPTVGGLYRVEYTTRPDPVPLGKLFEVDVVVSDARTGEPVDDADVRVDATMPQHGHGMTTKPETLPAADGHYLTRGMKLHMPGDWVLRVDVDGPAGRDHVDLPYRL